MYEEREWGKGKREDYLLEDIYPSNRPWSYFTIFSVNYMILEVITQYTHKQTNSLQYKKTE